MDIYIKFKRNTSKCCQNTLLETRNVNAEFDWSVKSELAECVCVCVFYVDWLMTVGCDSFGSV